MMNLSTFAQTRLVLICGVVLFSFPTDIFGQFHSIQTQAIDQDLTDQSDKYATQAAQALLADNPEKAADLYRMAWQRSLNQDSLEKTAKLYIDYQKYAKEKTELTDFVAPVDTTKLVIAYLEKLQAHIKRADDASLQASKLIINGKFQAAVEQYRKAFVLLPQSPITAQRRINHTKQYCRAAVTLAERYTHDGHYNEAMALIEDTLRPWISPNNVHAKRLLQQLNDPAHFPPALTSKQLERVSKINKAISVTQEYLDYGDYDRADREYQKVLHQDHYKSAQDSNLEGERLNYYDVARDSTRSVFTQQLAEDWECPTPEVITERPAR